MSLVLSTSGAPLFLPFTCQPFSGQHCTNSLPHLESTFSSNQLIGSWESQQTREWGKTISSDRKLSDRQCSENIALVYDKRFKLVLLVSCRSN